MASIQSAISINTLTPDSYYFSCYVNVYEGEGYFGFRLINSAGTVFQAGSFNVMVNQTWQKIEKDFYVASTQVGVSFLFDILAEYSSNFCVDEIHLGYDRKRSDLGVIQIYPEWDLKRETIQNRADHRTKGGKLYSYKWGSFERHTIPIDFIQNSKAATVNSWWATDALIHLKIYSGGVWETNCYHIMNGSAPFPDRVKPYYQYKKGTLVLETF